MLQMAWFHFELTQDESTEQQILWLVDRETTAPDANENDSEEDEDEDERGLGEGLINGGKHDQSGEAIPKVDVGVDPRESISMGSDGEL